MSKKIAFIVLSILAFLFCLLGLRQEPEFLSDVWSQLFWLTVGTLATVFILESILERDAKVRQRLGDAFAFRTFSATMMDALQQMVGLDPKKQNLFEAALSGDQRFERATVEVVSRIEQSSRFEPSIYQKYYSEVASDLRGFSKHYIRLFSASREEMVAEYQGLNELASLWGYIDEFSENSEKYTTSLPGGAPERLAREAAFLTKQTHAHALVVRTARHLAKLALKNASGKNMYGRD